MDNLPKVSILDTVSGKFMVWSTKEATSVRLLQVGITEHISIELSKILIRSSKNKHILDIGANLGTYAIPLGIAFGNEIRISCFEPQRHVFHQLCGNIFLNQLRNIFTYNIAIGSIDSQLSIPEIDYEKCWNVGGFSLFKNSYNARGDFPKESIIGSTQVEMKKLDSIVDLPLAGLIKIDVEGCEKLVVEGMLSYLKDSGYPPIIYEEWDFDWFVNYKDRLVNVLQNIGYDLFSEKFDDRNCLVQNRNSIHPIILIENYENGFRTHKFESFSLIPINFLEKYILKFN